MNSDNDLSKFGGVLEVKPGCCIATLCISLCVGVLTMPARAQEKLEKRLPTVLMLEVKGVTPHHPELYRAIRAQLSNSPAILEKRTLSDDEAFRADTVRSARDISNANGASMVFWIEDDETCQLFFYIPDRDGGHIRSRGLNLESNSSWSRFQVIAIAAAGTIEGLLVTHNIQPARKPKPVPVKEITPLVTRPVQVPRPRRWLELSAAYTGAFFAPELVRNGAVMGLGVRPLENLVIAVAFTWNAPMTVETDEYRLSLKSKILELSLAGRVVMNAFDFRWGLAWSMDLRSSSIAFRTDSFDGAPDELNGISAFQPFVSAIWRFSERLGLTGRIGVGFALNDTVYKMNRFAGVTEELSPFHVQLNCELGLNIQL